MYTKPLLEGKQNINQSRQTVIESTLKTIWTQIYDSKYISLYYKYKGHAKQELPGIKQENNPYKSKDLCSN